MAVIETWIPCELQRPVQVHYLDGNLFSHNGNANRIGAVVTNNGQNVTLTGTVSGYAVLSDGTTVPCTGSKAGNRASVLVPPAAYMPGPISVSVFLTDGTTVTTLAAITSTVLRSRTDTQVDPGSVVTDWTNTINAAMQAVEDAAENLDNIVATPYESITFPVPVGAYTIHNHSLYRCNTPIPSSGTWAQTEASWTGPITVMGQVNGLRYSIAEEWDSSKTYQLGDYVGYNRYYWRSRKNGNTGNAPASGLWWADVDVANDLKRAINNHSISDEIKLALLACFANVAWSTPDGLTNYDALEVALYPPQTLVSITAVYTQSGTVYDTASLSTLRSDLVVIANYSDGSSEQVHGYLLSGTLTEGTSVIVVYYGGQSASFTVSVTDSTLIYRLPQSTAFDGSGSGIINTGIDLFPTDRDLTITLSIIGSTTHNFDWVFWYGTTTSPYTGLNMQYRGQGYGYALCASSNNANVRADCPSYRDGSITKYVIRKRSGQNAEIYCYNEIGGSSSGVVGQNNVVAPGCTLMLGGVGGSAFDSYNYIGTIADFNVYTKYYTDAEKARYLGV